MPTSITYSLADGMDRNESGVASALLDLIGRGKPGWHADAACREHPELTWFAEQGANQTAAKAVCERCLVVAECRSWALAQGADLQGLWGGLSDQERKVRRRAG